MPHPSDGADTAVAEITANGATNSGAIRSRETDGVLFQAAVFGGSGYAAESIAAIMALHREGIPLQLITVGAQEDSDRILPEDIRRTLEQLKKNTISHANSIHYQSGPAVAFDSTVRGRFRIGRSMFETAGLPIGWADACGTVDEVWVASEFNRKSFSGAGVPLEKIRVVPDGVDTTRYRPGLAPLEFPGKRGFNFLSIFDWQDRKGPDLLLRAYLDEFGPDEDVALILKTTTINRRTEDVECLVLEMIERALGKKIELSPSIVLLSGAMPGNDLPRLYASADCFVLPTRGEGWGLPFMEALACELPVIATRWSGHLDFLHDRNSLLIDNDGVEPVAKDIDLETFVGQHWAAPNVTHLRKLMRHAFVNRMQVREMARYGAREMAERWSEASVTRIWVNEFKRVLGRAKSPDAEKEI